MAGLYAEGLKMNELIIVTNVYPHRAFNDLSSLFFVSFATVANIVYLALHCL